MGKMERIPKPPDVQRAVFVDDHATLSAMGRKGAEAAALNRDIEKAIRTKEIEDAVAAQAKLYSLSPEGDVLPPESS